MAETLKLIEGPHILSCRNKGEYNYAESKRKEGTKTDYRKEERKKKRQTELEGYRGLAVRLGGLPESAPPDKRPTVRFLIYLAEEYQKLVEQAEASIYGTKQVILPAPQCIVFYNGEKAMPEEQILCLSDAFEKQKSRSDVELKVRMLNINYGNNLELMEKCRVLKEYAEFVEIARKYVKEGKERQEALNMAIGYCIEHDILSEFLKSYRAEVLGMLLEEFDVDKYERTIKAEGREEGREEILELTRKLMEQNRMDDLKRLAEDSAYREKLFREFGL